MDTPALIRPLRQTLQGRLRFTCARRVQNVYSSQLRSNSSITQPPPSATPSPSPPALSETNQQQAVKGPKEEEVSGRPPARLPRSVSTLYLAPLRRQAEYGVPSCDLQLRSFSVPNLEFFCDFALRAAYYLGLPAYGPIPLPRIIQRWTVPKASFIFKKSQENFERITLRRLIQIKDGHPETVQIWLAFLQKHQYYGVGMKANVWEFSKLDVGKNMDAAVKEVEGALEDKWAHLGQHNSGPNDTIEKIEEFLIRERAKAENRGSGDGNQ